VNSRAPQWARHVSQIGKAKIAYRISEKKLLGRVRRREDDIKMELRETEFKDGRRMELLRIMSNGERWH
jgi:hypothetical protein